MITLFSLPKPFEGHNAIIQRNAIQSWLHLRPAPQVILCGGEAGIAETAREFGVDHIPAIPLNDYGTPLLNGAFARAQADARYERVCYINTDIILLPDFLAAVQCLRFPKYLMIGRRWNLDIRQALDFSDPSWAEDLRRRVVQEGVLFPPAGSDYFLFVKGSLGELPPFVVGRPGWDNWMIYNARMRRLPVVDATHATPAIHQNHDYRHIRDAYQPNAYTGPEADYNLNLMGGHRALFVIDDATHVLAGRRVIPALGPQHLARRIRTLAVLNPSLRPLADRLKGLSRKIGR
jgi:hypothetical protein